MSIEKLLNNGHLSKRDAAIVLQVYKEQDHMSRESEKIKKVWNLKIDGADEAYSDFGKKLAEISLHRNDVYFQPVNNLSDAENGMANGYYNVFLLTGVQKSTELAQEIANNTGISVAVAIVGDDDRFDRFELVASDKIYPEYSHQPDFILAYGGNE